MKDKKIKGMKVVVVSGLFLMSDVFANGSSLPAETTPAAAPKTEKHSRATVELGALYVSKDSHKFGDYWGLEEKGGYLVANINAERRDPHDGATARYWNFEGSNLGLTSREAFAEHGNQADPPAEAIGWSSSQISFFGQKTTRLSHEEHKS